MKKTWIAVLGVAAVCLGFSPGAFAWERGTHAFIAQRVKQGGGPSTVEAMYAATAPDSFNYFFTMPGLAYRDFLYNLTHFDPLKISAAVRYGYEKNAAAGFISHNNEWGADRTAHTKSITLNPNEGYIITKAKMLNSYLMADAGYAALVGSAPDAALEICHDICEAAGDVILKRSDNTVGWKLCEIAIAPRPNVRNLMVRAYADDLVNFSASTPVPLTLDQAKSFIGDAEYQFRLGSLSYGFLLMGSEDALIANVIDQYKSLAGAFLSAYGLPVPDDATLTQLITSALNIALTLVQPDYMNEVLATVDYVKAQMKAHSIQW